MVTIEHRFVDSSDCGGQFQGGVYSTHLDDAESGKHVNPHDWTVVDGGYTIVGGYPDQDPSRLTVTTNEACAAPTPQEDPDGLWGPGWALNGEVAAPDPMPENGPGWLSLEFWVDCTATLPD